MTVKLSQEIKEIFLDKESIKVLGTVDEFGVPHVVFKDSIDINAKGEIVYLELIETSITNRNLVSSIWFDRKVSINVVDKNKKSYQIKGIPTEAIISGAIFEKYYEEVQRKLGDDYDLSTVWIIEPEIVVEQTLSVRIKIEEEKHPLLKHLDRLAK